VNTDYALVFITGLLGGFGHCVGMCGPIVAAFTLPGRESFRVAPHLLYHAGRVITYTFIGALMGLGGSFVNTAGKLAGLQNGVALIAGFFMIVMGVGITGFFPRLSRSTVNAGSAGWYRRVLSLLGSGGSGGHWFPLGLLLGFLPCGLSYSVFLAAAAGGDALRGFTLALVFGLATTPSLLLFGAVVGSVGLRVRGLLYRAGGVVIIVMGLIFLKRGMAAYVAM
jgi:sulfite exporter TauE/SafE